MGNSEGQECVKILGWDGGSVKGAIQLRNGWLVSWSNDTTLKVWGMDNPEGLGYG